MDMHEQDPSEDPSAHLTQQPSKRGLSPANLVPRILVVLVCIALAILVQTIATRTWGDSMMIRWCVRAALLLSFAAAIARLRFGSN
jgi:hypothetical protein